MGTARRKYIFKNRTFWIILTGAYILLFMLSGVSVGWYVNMDISNHKFEPVWHLILRNQNIINNNEYIGFEPTLKPILYQLPSFILSALVLTAILCFIIFIVQKYILKSSDRGT